VKQNSFCSLEKSILKNYLDIEVFWAYIYRHV